MVGRFAAGTQHNVYYDPANPRESVLRPGIQQEDFCQALLGLPLLMATFWAWAMFISLLRRPRGFRGLVVIQSGSITRIRPSGVRILTTSAWALAGTAFGLNFTTGFVHSLDAALGLWLLTLVVTAIVALVMAIRIRSGTEDIVLDDRSGLGWADRRIPVRESVW